MIRTQVQNGKRYKSYCSFKQKNLRKIPDSSAGTFVACQLFDPKSESQKKWKSTNWIPNCSPTGISGCSYTAGTAGFFVLNHMGVEDFKLTLATLLQEQHHLHAWRSTLRRNFVKHLQVKVLHFFPGHIFSVQCHAHEDKQEAKGKCMSSSTKN